MREVPRDELGIKVWIDEEKLSLCCLHDFSKFIEVIKNSASCDGDSQRPDSFHAKFVPSLIEHSQHGSNTGFNIFGQSRIHFGDLRLKLGDSLDRVPSIDNCGCPT